MADTPTAAFSLRIRVRMANKPGDLGRLAVAIGEVGGNIAGLDGFLAKQAFLEEDIIVDCRSEAHQAEVLAAIEVLDGIDVLAHEDRTFKMHEGGKIEVLPLAPVGDRDDLSMAYTPGVARVCNAIAADPKLAHELTIKKNTVAIVSDGTAVLGLGDIGPAAAMPVMEGKALLFKEFAGVDAFPICLDVTRRRRDRRDGRAPGPDLRRHQPRGHRRARSASRSRSGSRSCSTSRCSTTTSTAPPSWCWPPSRTR